jgi:hypothetical protein
MQVAEREFRPRYPLVQPGILTSNRFKALANKFECDQGLTSTESIFVLRCLPLPSRKPCPRLRSGAVTNVRAATLSAAAESARTSRAAVVIRIGRKKRCHGPCAHFPPCGKGWPYSRVTAHAWVMIPCTMPKCSLNRHELGTE